MTIESQAAFARRIGVNRSTVFRHVEAGRVVVVGKMIDVEASLALLEATTGTRPDVTARHAAEKQSQPATDTAQPEKIAPAPENGALSASAVAEKRGDPKESKSHYKAQALAAENNTILLERDLRRGRRHALASVKKEAAGVGATLRSALERLVDQTAPRLAVMPQTAARADLIRAEIAAVRRLIRAEFPRALRRIRKQGSQA